MERRVQRGKVVMLWLLHLPELPTQEHKACLTCLLLPACAALRCPALPCPVRCRSRFCGASSQRSSSMWCWGSTQRQRGSRGTQVRAPAAAAACRADCPVPACLLWFLTPSRL